MKKFPLLFLPMLLSFALIVACGGGGADGEGATSGSGGSSAVSGEDPKTQTQDVNGDVGSSTSDQITIVGTGENRVVLVNVDDNGKIVITGENLTLVELNDGNWQLVEGIEVSLKDAAGNIIPGTVYVNPATGDITFTPSVPLEIGETYTLVVTVNGETHTATVADFNYSTVYVQNYDLTLKNAATKEPVAGALITIKDADGNIISSAVTGADGNADFPATINKSVENIVIVITHPGYETRTVTVENAQSIAAVVREIMLTAIVTEEPVVIIDSDGDGIADENDQYPNDASLIATVEKTYVIAFEDGYPAKGDADFNDLVVRLRLKEFINPENKVSKVEVGTTVLAAGAGYNNQFWISVGGIEKMLINNAKTTYLNGSDNCVRGKESSFVKATEVVETFVFTTPIARNQMPVMPYDPFIKCNGVHANQVHLPFAATTFTGKVLDDDGFPWAILVPENWYWPYEESGSTIFNAYTLFKEWYESQGTKSVNWYLTYVKDKVFVPR